MPYSTGRKMRPNWTRGEENFLSRGNQRLNFLSSVLPLRGIVSPDRKKHALDLTENSGCMDVFRPLISLHRTTEIKKAVTPYELALYD
jgi:hypothetical protein